jgi:VCBS repeat protein
VLTAGAIALGGRPAAAERGGAGERAPAAAASPTEVRLRGIWDAVAARLAAAAAERAQVLRPPRPHKVVWRARRITSLDLGAPLLALAAGDIDGDGRAEILALTERELVALRPSGPRSLAEIARVALPAETAAIQPRDPVGALSLTDASGDGILDVLARTSRTRAGAAYGGLRDALVALAPLSGFPVCPGLAPELVEGRNYFDGASVAAASAAALGGPLPSRFFAARCRDDLVDPEGRRMRARTVVDTAGVAQVVLQVACRDGDGGPACPKAGWRSAGEAAIGGAGTAFELADVDADGRPELIVAADGAPGDPDAVAVYTIAPGATSAAGRNKRIFRKGFAGGVAGIAAGDVDGDGDLDAVAAVRLVGSQRVDLWLLN